MMAAAIAHAIGFKFGLSHWERSGISLACFIKIKSRSIGFIFKDRISVESQSHEESGLRQARRRLGAKPRVEQLGQALARKGNTPLSHRSSYNAVFPV